MSGIREIWVFANHVIRSSRQLVNEKLKPLNLSSAQGNILLHLFTQGDARRQEDLVEQLDISRPAVSKALDALQKKGFIERTRDKEDRRVRRVYLTEKAWQVGPKIESIYNEVLTLAARDLSPEEIKSFIQVFQRVSENFNQTRNKEKAEEEVIHEQ